MEQTLEQVVSDVKKVLEINQQGKSISEIALTLNLQEEYVYNILTTLQGLEDADAESIAHLLLMG